MKKSVLYLLLFVLTNCLYSQEQFSVYFESNRFSLSGTENNRLQDWISMNKTSKILAINGYTDEDGSTRYNDSLSQKRVQKIVDIIDGKVKIREDFKIISFGELHNQSKIKAENRKVTLFFLKEKDLSREAEIVGSKSANIKPQKIKEFIGFPDKISVTNFDGTKSEISLDVAFMETFNKAKAGEKLKLENLNFVLNTFAITKESRSKLYELLLVMQKNPNIKINIQGHLCCLAVDRRDLSTQRAKAVKQFLEHNGIESARMTYKGFGSSVPLFPLPEKTEEERAANRRVEIEVLQN
jgi:outer membrane protein OmpA-like peptidoglycan-associated protein